MSFIEKIDNIFASQEFDPNKRRTLKIMGRSALVVGAALLVPDSAHATSGKITQQKETDQAESKWGVEALKAMGGEETQKLTEAQLNQVYARLKSQLPKLNTLRNALIAAHNLPAEWSGPLKFAINDQGQLDLASNLVVAGEIPPGLSLEILSPGPNDKFDISGFITALKYTGPDAGGYVLNNSLLWGLDARPTSKGFYGGVVTRPGGVGVVQFTDNGNVYMSRFNGVWVPTRNTNGTIEYLSKDKVGNWRVFKKEVKPAATKEGDYTQEQIDAALANSKSFAEGYGFFPEANEYGKLGYISGVPLDFPKESFKVIANGKTEFFWQVPVATIRPDGIKIWINVVLSTNSNLMWGDASIPFPREGGGGGSLENTTDFVNKIRSRYGDRPFSGQAVVFTLYDLTFANLEGFNMGNPSPIEANVLKGKWLGDNVKFGKEVSDLRENKMINGGFVGGASMWATIR